jgi:hypothetical protein
MGDSKNPGHQVQPPIRLLYIAGWGRSGSTILSQLLNEVPGVHSTGELYRIWSNGFQRDQICGCGLPMSQCPIWSQIMGDLLADEEKEANVRRLKWIEKITRTRHVWRYMPRLLGRKTRWSAQEWDNIRVLDRLYTGLIQATGANILVDSTKSPLYLTMLKSLPSLDIRVIHLIRDPRATAYSWQKHKFDSGTRRFMHQHGALNNAAQWSVWNVATDRLLKQVGGPDQGLRMLYEELIRNPDEQLSRISSLLPLEDIAWPAGSNRRYHLGENHMISGNPIRYKTGHIQLALDDRWKTELSMLSTLITNILCGPLMLSYGYVPFSKEH